jgi:hypothetical protein
MTHNPNYSDHEARAGEAHISQICPTTGEKNISIRKRRGRRWSEESEGSSPLQSERRVHLGVAKAALGTIDAKSSAVIGAERRSHVMVAITFSTEATKSPRIHFAALARKFTLLLRVQDMILDMQKRAG